MTGPVLSVRDLAREYRVRAPAGGGVGRTVHAVRGVSFDLAEGESLGLVGESGSGKSTLARLILQLERADRGTVLFGGTELGSLGAGALRRIRREIQIIFQDRWSSLDPRLTIGASIAEGPTVHRLADRAGVRTMVDQVLLEVGLSVEDADRYPHQLSGGQRQRVAIARALILQPRLLVCDEPVSALDVSVQAQILELLRGLQERHRLSLLFIAHDLAVVRQLCDRIAVMYGGRLMEIGPARDLIAEPAHPYTRALLSDAAQRTGRTDDGTARLRSGPAVEPDGSHGCPLAPRCPHPARDRRCEDEVPLLRAVGAGMIACHHAAPREPAHQKGVR